jgi:hypothetical protein
VNRLDLGWLQTSGEESMPEAADRIVQEVMFPRIRGSPHPRQDLFAADYGSSAVQQTAQQRPLRSRQPYATGRPAQTVAGEVEAA